MTNLKSVLHSNDEFWSFVMLPNAQSMSAVPPFLWVLLMYSCLS
jgi:hypothetical protein